jgi:ABC-type tungstate transport system permease subunit
MNDAAVEGLEPSGWVEITRENPGHSSWYVERFRTMAAALRIADQRPARRFGRRVTVAR